MRHFHVPEVRDDATDVIAKSRADLLRRRAQIDGLHAVTAETRQQVREARDLLERADFLLRRFDNAWRGSP
jgi:hypothetical protein